MASVHPFRRLWHGPPRKLATPRFPRVRRRWLPRLPQLRQFAGLVALAALMAAGAYHFGLVQDQGVPRSLVSVTAVDGDSLRAGGENIRLRGIDAPELHQTCLDETGRPWPCGRVAHSELQALLARGEVRCTAGAQDRYGRTLSTCSAGDIADLGEALVRAGYAVDFSRTFFDTYRAAEAEARAARRGIWRGSFDPPQDWRKRHPRKD